MVSVETATGCLEEEQVKALLDRLLSDHDTSSWEFTDRVVIEHLAIPRSHPVLTLGTKFIVATPLGVLTTYLHEQIHWYLIERGENTASAIEELRQRYPHVPDRDHGGARNDYSTYLHLLVNWLELESLRTVVGPEKADETLRQAVDGPVYGWIYRRVFGDHDLIGGVVRRNQLDDLIRSR
jgi:hypothetical protein